MTILDRCLDSPLRERIGLPIVLLSLVGLAAAGAGMVFRPKRHLRGYTGGQMHREFQEMGAQLCGIVFMLFACWAIYEFVKEVWANCFA